MKPTEPTTYQRMREATDSILSKISARPKLGMILGSGLGPIADAFTDAITIRYSEIPHFYGTSVEGHSGEMLIGNFGGIPTVALKGRFHLYEGYPMDDVVFPTRTLCALGIENLVLTNAAGGINTRFRSGDLMVITDHINLMGDNPLKGPNIAEMGPRFPDMTHTYNANCRTILLEKARALKIPVWEGVYAGVLGPTYETPAEVRMLRTLGADAVGMSTVPEAIAAHHLGVRVVGMSLVTNLAAGMSPTTLSHREVIESSARTVSQIRELLLASAPEIVKTTTLEPKA